MHFLCGGHRRKSKESWRVRNLLIAPITKGHHIIVLQDARPIEFEAVCDDDLRSGQPVDERRVKKLRVRLERGRPEARADDRVARPDGEDVVDDGKHAGELAGAYRVGGPQVLAGELNDVGDDRRPDVQPADLERQSLDEVFTPKKSVDEERANCEQANYFQDRRRSELTDGGRFYEYLAGDSQSAASFN